MTTGRSNLVWRSSDTKALNRGGNPDKNYERLQKVMDKLLKDLPPKK
jgi:hypothetical protein